MEKESNLHIIQHISNSGIIKLKNVILKVPSYYQYWYTHPEWWTTHINKKISLATDSLAPTESCGVHYKVQHSQAFIVLARLTKPKTQSQIICISSLLTQVFSFRINVRSQTGSWCIILIFRHATSTWALHTSIREIIRETDGKKYFKNWQWKWNAALYKSNADESNVANDH